MSYASDNELFFDPAVHRRVLASEIDVPCQRPSFSLPLDRVGIAAKTLWVRLPQGRVPFTAEVTVSLTRHRRGIHMSRIEEEVTRLAGQTFADPAAYAKELCLRVAAAQEARRSEVDLRGLLPVERTGRVSGQRSQDSLVAAARCRFEDGDLTCERQVGVYHITACPCTQVYTEGAIGQGLPGGCPYPSHSQRSLTTLALGSREDVAVGFDDLAAVLGEALHLVHDLLKRPDEAELVLACHQHPQFAEDVVRQVALACGRRFSGVLAPDTTIRIESRSQESIHIHDVVCALSTSLGGICQQMAATASDNAPAVGPAEGER